MSGVKAAGARAPAASAGEAAPAALEDGKSVSLRSMGDSEQMLPALNDFEPAVGLVHLAHEAPGFRIGDIFQLERRLAFAPRLGDAQPGVPGGQDGQIIVGKKALELRQIVN